MSFSSSSSLCNSLRSLGSFSDNWPPLGIRREVDHPKLSIRIISNPKENQTANISTAIHFPQSAPLSVGIV